MFNFRLCEITKQYTFVFKATLILPVFLYAISVSAFTAKLETFPVQYDVVTIQKPETEQLILGELSDAPEMYEIISDTPFVLTVEIRAVPDPGLTTAPQLSGIIIKQKEIRGVEEIARLNATDAAWTVVTDESTGLKYQAGGYYSEQVEAGTYRIEISSPSNQGKYMLQVGTIKDDAGYFASLSAIAVVYSFYELGTLRMISSPSVHYPIGIVLLLSLLGGTYLWHRKQKHHA